MATMLYLDILISVVFRSTIATTTCKMSAAEGSAEPNQAVDVSHTSIKHYIIIMIFCEC